MSPMIRPTPLPIASHFIKDGDSNIEYLLKFTMSQVPLVNLLSMALTQIYFGRHFGVVYCVNFEDSDILILFKLQTLSKAAFNPFLF